MLFRSYCRKDFEQPISDYRCRWLIKACYNAQADMYEFTLDRKDISISHQENLKLMDKISMEMGNVFYPLQLLTVPTMGVQKIVNLGNIKRRWTEKAVECCLAYPGEVLEQYLEDSENNMSNDRKLCKYLYRDSFINMYFRNMYALTALYAGKKLHIPIVYTIHTMYYDYLHYLGIFQNLPVVKKAVNDRDRKSVV